MVRQRILFGTLMVAALIGLFWLDGWLAQAVRLDPPPALLRRFKGVLQPGVMLTCVWAVLVVLGTREMAALLRSGGYRPAAIWAGFCNVGLAFLPWGRWITDPGREAEQVLLVIVVALVGAFVCVARRRQTGGAFADIAATLFLVIYLGLLGSYISRMLMWGPSTWLLLYVLIVIKSADIGAYFTGLAVGRHKLIPWLSPGKTVEGLCGGIVLAMAVAAGLARLVAGIPAETTSRLAAAGVDLGVPGAASLWPGVWPALTLGAAMAVFGQIGDLLESLMKRSVGAKDSGAAVPSFGGLLDLLDSPLLCVPLAYWMLLE